VKETGQNLLAFVQRSLPWGLLFRVCCEKLSAVVQEVFCG
jgi:hypothetical protein